jgi:uncharacterized protein (DUF488 family)
MRIYTLGYPGWTIEAVRSLLAQANALLVDVRLVPSSRFNPAFRAASLRKALGDAYVCVSDWGNLNYKNDGPIQLRSFSGGLATVEGRLCGHDAVVLLCGCADVNVCHRKVVAARLAETWACPVEHLSRPSRDPDQGRLF